MVTVRKLWLVRIALLAFGVVFVGIIVIANRGEGGRYWAFLDAVPMGDKLGHVGLVGTLTFLLNLALAARRAPGRLGFALLGSLIVFVAMSAEEISQAWQPARTCDALDWLANVVGIAAADLAARWVCRWGKGARSAPEP